MNKVINFINLEEKNICMPKKYTVLLEKAEDDWIIASVPEIQGCHTQGKDVAQAMERIKEAIQVCVETDDKTQENTFLGVQFVEV